MRRLVLLGLVVLVSGCGAGASPRPRPGDLRATIALRDTPPLAAARGSWRAFGGGPAHPGLARVTGPRSGAERWRRRLDGALVPGIVTRGPTAYVATSAGVLHALDIATGHERWRTGPQGAYGSDLSTAPAVLGDGRILWPGPGDALLELDGGTGRIRGRTAFDAAPTSPAVHGDRAWVQDTGGTLTQLRLSPDGVAVSWRVRLGTSSSASAALDAHAATVFTAVGRELVAVDARTGRVRWRRPTRGEIEVSPAVTPGGLVTVGSNDGHQYAFRADGSTAWSHALGDLTYSSAAATPDGLVYVGDHRGVVSGLDARTGRVRFRVLGAGRTPRERNVGVWTMPVVDRHHAVYFGTHPGHLHGFAADGRRLLDVDLGGVVDGYPALAADGTLLAGSESGLLVALEPGGA